MPRPPAIDPTIQSQLCSLIAARVPITECCKRVGIGKATFYRWLTWGDPDFDPTTWTDPKQKPPKSLTIYRDFWDAVERARDQLATSAAILVQRKVNAMLQQKPEDVAMNDLLRLLAVVDPERWSPKVEHRHGGDPSNPIVQTVQVVEFDKQTLGDAAQLADAVGLGNVVPITKAKRGK